MAKMKSNQPHANTWINHAILINIENKNGPNLTTIKKNVKQSYETKDKKQKPVKTTKNQREK